MARVIAGPLNYAMLKGLIQQKIQEDVDGYWRDKISSLVMLGDFLSLLNEEDTCVTWKCFIWSVPRGVAKFEPKRTSDLCTVCSLGRKQTLNHILSYCSQARKQVFQNHVPFGTLI